MLKWCTVLLKRCIYKLYKSSSTNMYSNVTSLRFVTKKYGGSGTTILTVGGVVIVVVGETE